MYAVFDIYTWITGALSILCFNLTKIVFPPKKEKERKCENN